MSIDAVVFVPGICGSVLKEGDTTVWPGTPGNAVLQTYPDEYVDILASSTTVRATDVLRNVPLTVFGVPDAQKTVVANNVQAAGATVVEEETSGDGTVPLWSAAPPGIPVRYVAATHGDIFKDGDAEAVLRPGTPGARPFSLGAGPAPSLSAQAVNTSVSPGANFTVAIVADRPTNVVDANVKVERAFVGGRLETERVPIRYSGGPVRTIPLEFVAPEDRAALKFTTEPNAAATAGDPATVLVIG